MADVREGGEALWRGKIRVRVGRPIGAGDFVIYTPDGKEIAAPANTLRPIDTPPSDQQPGIVRK